MLIFINLLYVLDIIFASLIAQNKATAEPLQHSSGVLFLSESVFFNKLVE